MKKPKQKTNYFILTLFVMIFISCKLGGEKFIIEEIETTSYDTITTKTKFVFKSYGSHMSYSSNGSNKDKNVTINFRNEQLSDILDKLEYSFNKGGLKNNPVLNIEFHKENTTKEKAINRIINSLKKSYNF